MEPKKREFTISLENITDRIVLLVVLGIIGGPGIVSMVVPGARPDAFTGTQGRELKQSLNNQQRQIDEIKQNDLETRQLLQELINDYHEHIEWGRDVRSDNTGTLQRHEAQIQELYRRLP